MSAVDGRGAPEPHSWTAAAKLEAAIRGPLGSGMHRADTRLIERPGWYQVITPSAAGGAINEVALSELADDEVERVIDETVAAYRRHGLTFRWCVGPWTKPADMGARLERRGFTGWPTRGMVCDPTALRFDPPAGASLERVDAASLDAYVAAVIRGWALPASEAATMRAACLAMLAHGEAEMFVVRIDGVIAGTAGHVLRPDGSAYLVGGQVMEEHRGRGVYRALIEARLASLRARGITLATTQAREQTSAPMLEHLGFETVFRSQVYLLEAR